MSLSLRFLFHVKTKTEEFPLKHIHSICKSVPKLLFQNLKFQTFKIASDYKYQYRYMYLEYRAVSLEWIYMAILLNLFLPLINYMLMTFFNVAIFRVHLGNFFNEWQSKLETFLDYSVSLCESSVIYCEYIWFRTQRHLLVRLFNQNLLQTRLLEKRLNSSEITQIHSDTCSLHYLYWYIANQKWMDHRTGLLSH